MKSLFILALLTSILALFLASIINAPAIEIAMTGMLFALVFLSRGDDNSQLLTICFAFVFSLSSVCMYLLEQVIYPSISSYFIENMLAFSVQLTLSLLLLLLLRHRMKIAVLLTKGQSASVFERNYAEGPLYFLVLVLVFVDFFALSENFIRNLDQMGFTQETAKMFWEFTFFYDYFAYLKVVPMLLCVLMLYVGLIVRTRNHQLQS